MRACLHTPFSSLLIHPLGHQPGPHTLADICHLWARKWPELLAHPDRGPEGLSYNCTHRGQQEVLPGHLNMKLVSGLLAHLGQVTGGQYYLPSWEPGAKMGVGLPVPSYFSLSSLHASCLSIHPSTCVLGGQQLTGPSLVPPHTPFPQLWPGPTQAGPALATLVARTPITGGCLRPQVSSLGQPLFPSLAPRTLLPPHFLPSTAICPSFPSPEPSSTR